MEGKIQAINYARVHQIPYFGICFGMQLAVIEFARHVAGLSDAQSEEFDAENPHPVIYLMREWFDYRRQTIVRRDRSADKGGTMRLGAYPGVLKENSLAAKAYKTLNFHERHRHRYEFNNTFRDQLTQNGLVISGTSPNGELVEIIELDNHPWFLGCQFHPEFKSRPLQPHPLFIDYIRACIEHKRG